MRLPEKHCPATPERNSMMYDAAYFRHFREFLYASYTVNGKKKDDRGIADARSTAREQQIREAVAR